MADGTWSKWVAVLGATGVGAGAFGAHALKQTLLQRNSTDSWKTAVMYQLIHTVSLLALTHRRALESNEVTAANLWVSGTVLFSGSIYALSLGAGERFKFIGPITPVGGLLLIGGWVSLGFSSGASRRA